MLSLPPAASTTCDRRRYPAVPPPLEVQLHRRRPAPPSQREAASPSPRARRGGPRAAGERARCRTWIGGTLLQRSSALEAEGVVGRDPRQRLAPDRRRRRRACGAGRRQPAAQDRPARSARPARPSQGRGAEVDGVERQAAPAPEVRGAAEPARHGDLRRVVAGAGRGSPPPTAPGPRACGSRPPLSSTQHPPPRRASASALTIPTGPAPITQIPAPKAGDCAKSGASAIISPPTRSAPSWHGGFPAAKPPGHAPCA